MSTMIFERPEDEDCETARNMKPERVTSRFMKKLAALIIVHFSQV